MVRLAPEVRLETLRVEQDGRVLTVRFEDPPHNFMTARMQQDLDVLTRAVDDDASVGAVVFTGGPAERYVTHFDISEILAAAESAPGAVPERAVRAGMRGIELASAVPGAENVLKSSPVSGILNVTRFNEVVLRVMRSPAVYIAAINGPCGGGGLEMSVCFDVRLIADEGAGCTLPELLIGLTSTVGGQRLAQLIGPARALELMLEGRMYSAQEAAELGLVNRVVARGELLATAQELGARYARRNRDAIAAQKRIFNEDLSLPPAQSLRREGAANVAGIVSGPAPRALRAWVEMQQRGGGESVFLTDPEPWVRGEAVDLNPH
jgi:enoyl-CoA hydratase